MPSIPEQELKDGLSTENAEVREITQTDHLNKKLLTYFLQRINSGNVNMGNDPKNSDESATKDEEWEK